MNATPRYVPHGFALEDVTVEERPTFLAPETLSEWLIRAKLSVPVIYSPDPSPIPLRASTATGSDHGSPTVPTTIR